MEHKLLTILECEQILAVYSGCDMTLKDYKIMPALEAHGFLGEYYRLFLNCTESHSNKYVVLKFFIKSIPQASEEIEKAIIFEKEANLYKTLLKELKTCSTTIWCPQVFYTRRDLIVLEDLCSLGYEKCNSSNFDLKAILKALAALHAATIIYETKNGIQINKQFPADLFKEITVSPQIKWYTTGLKTILDLSRVHPKFQSSKLQNFIANDLKLYFERVYDMQEPSEKYRNVLCHRDPWHSNVLYNHATNNAVLVDYQTSRYCPPAIDVIFALFINLDIKLRKSNELAYLEWYYKLFEHELSEHKIDATDHMSYMQFLTSYQDFVLFGYLYRAIALTLINVPKELITNDYKYNERTGKLLNYMTVNKEFRLQMEDCIEELLNYSLVEFELH